MREVRFETVVEDPEIALPPKLLHRELWDSMVSFVQRYEALEPTYLMDLAKTGFERGLWQADPKHLVYSFPDSALSFHAFQLAQVFHRTTLERLAEQLGVKLKAPHVTPEAALASAKLELTDAVICKMLLPEPEFEAKFCADAASEDIHVSADGVEYLLTCLKPSNDALLALAQASVRQGWYRQARAMFELGKRLSADRESFLLGTIRANDSTLANEAIASLAACVAGLPLDSRTRFEVLLDLKDRAYPVAEVAIEFLGYGTIHTGDHDVLIDTLRGIIGLRASLDEATALTLYNVFREEGASWQARSVLRTLQENGLGDSAEIAERALSWFARD